MGVELPVNKAVLRDFLETAMFIYEHHILIQAKPQIQESVRKQMR